MLTALALALAIPSALPSDVPRQGWLLGAWPEDTAAPLEEMTLEQARQERIRLKGELRSVGGPVSAIVSGAVLTPLGALTALVGLFMAAVTYSSTATAGVVVLISGGVLCLGGIALLIIGGKLRSEAVSTNEAVQPRLEQVEKKIEALEQAPPPPPPPEARAPRGPMHALQPA